MKRLLLISALFLASQWGCKTDLEPRLRKSRFGNVVAEPQGKINGAGVLIRYEISYGLDVVKEVTIQLIDVPANGGGTVQSVDTSPNRLTGKGSASIQNTTAGRVYVYAATARHNDSRVPNSVFRGEVTMPK